jgi:hypothetical protein
MRALGPRPPPQLPGLHHGLFVSARAAASAEACEWLRRTGVCSSL